MTIYMVVCLVNGKRYIGKTKNKLRYRWTAHKRGSTLLSAAIRKYGADNFTIEVLDTADSVPELNKLEVMYIRRYSTVTPNGYNVREGGAGGYGPYGLRRYEGSVVRGDNHYSRKHPEKMSRGEKHYAAKLTYRQVENIRRLYAKYKPTHKALAKVFGVNYQTIQHILADRTWKRG